MDSISSELLERIKIDLDKREDIIRRTTYEALAQLPAPDLSESIAASYFVWAHHLTPAQVGREICYHMTSDVHNYLFLAGSAINGIKNESGQYDPRIGAKAMEQVVWIYQKKIFDDISSCTVDNIRRTAVENDYAELAAALDQRYGK